VIQYIFAVRGNSVDQQKVATNHVQRNGRNHDCAIPHRRKVGGRCRDGGCDGACNAQHTLRILLSENGLFGGYLSERRAPTFDEIQGEINDGRPVACRVKWSNEAGHFVLVTGWTVDAAGARMVHVRDPGSAPRGQPIGEQMMPHSKFASDYRLSALRGVINYSYKVG
jgi:hypothetical protein